MKYTVWNKKTKQAENTKDLFLTPNGLLFRYHNGGLQAIVDQENYIVNVISESDKENKK